MGSISGWILKNWIILAIAGIVVTSVAFFAWFPSVTPPTPPYP